MPDYLKKFSKRAHIVIPMLVLLIAVVLRTWDFGWMTRIQFTVFDTFMQIQPRQYDPEIGVRIVDIDDESLERVGQWPWSRIKLATMIQNLKQAGAAVIVFDVVFAEQDRTSPPVASKEWTVFEGAEELIAQVQQLPDFDSFFASFLEANNPIVMGFVLTDGKLHRVPKIRGNFASSGADPRHFLLPFPGAVSNLPILEEAASGAGSFNVVPEIDGIIRRVPLLVHLQQEHLKDDQVAGMAGLYPSLVIEALRTVQGKKTLLIKASGTQGAESFGQETGISRIKVGDIIIPTDKQGQLWLHSTGHKPERYVPAWQVLEGNFDPAKFLGHVVFVGTSAGGLLDLRTTVLEQTYPGVEIHAEIAEQILSEHYIERPDWAVVPELAFIIVLGIVLICVMPRAGALWSAMIGGAFVLGAFGFSWYMFDVERMLFDPVYPSASTLGVYMAGTLIIFMQTEAEKRRVRTAFSTYLSPDLVSQLEQEPERLKLGGETKTLTFLFCDVRGFTTISESFKGNPQGLTLLINRFLTPLTNEILDRQGTIDKYMGDCIMAFWNAPLDVDEQEKKACDSALAMFEVMHALNEVRRGEAEAEGETFLPLNIGIGLNTGECVVGNMGSDQRFDYSVLGDAVNLAARLEGQSKSYGVGIVIGPDTATRSRDEYAILELDLIMVKGKKEAVDIYTVIGRKEMLDSQEFNDMKALHDDMIVDFRAQRWDDAEEKMSSLEGRLNGAMDGFYAIYRGRIAEYRADPPPADWDGVFVATTK